MASISDLSPARQQLPNRRANTSFDFTCNSLGYSATTPLGCALNLIAGGGQ